MKKTIITVLIVLGVFLVIGLGVSKWAISKYNNLIAMGQNVDKSWGQVENVLQRRSDLIPNLVNVVQAYAVQEQQVFINVAEARSGWLKAAQGTVQDKIKANNALSGALFNLMAVAESYPDLKSNQNFLALQDELAGTENRIAVERMRYNESVLAYNTYAKSFPNNMIAKFFDFKPDRDFFEAEAGANVAPKVNIQIPGAPAAPTAQPAPVTPPALPTPPQSAIPSQPAPQAAAPAQPQAMAAPTITPPQAEPVKPIAPVQIPMAPATPTAAVAPTAPVTPPVAQQPATIEKTIEPAKPVTQPAPAAPAPVAKPAEMAKPSINVPPPPTAPATTPPATKVTAEAKEMAAPAKAPATTPAPVEAKPAPAVEKAPATEPAAAPATGTTAPVMNKKTPPPAVQY